jgi:hypothetical protein
MSDNNTELVHISQPVGGEVVHPAADYVDTGLDNIKLKPTTVIMVQNTTRDPKGARGGQFVDIDTNEIFDSITMVPLRIWQTRVLFPPGSNLDAEPMCRSNNGLEPSPFSKVKQSSRCGYMLNGTFKPTCPQAIWKDDKKPPCAQKMRMIAINRASYLPFYFTIGGASIKSLNLTLANVKRDILVNERKNGIKLELFDYSLEVTSERVSNSSGVFYVAKFKPQRVLEVNEFGPFFQEFVASRGSEPEQDGADEVINAAVTTQQAPPEQVIEV